MLWKKRLREIRNVDELYALSRGVKWQFFERLVAFVFEENGFDVKQNKVIVFGKKKRQYDVIARHYNIIILVECKKWAYKHKRYTLLKAAEKQKERAELYKGYLMKNSRKRIPKIIPLIVTLMEENVVKHGGVMFVPLSKLNSFINEEL